MHHVSAVCSTAVQSSARGTRQSHGCPLLTSQCAGTAGRWSRSRTAPLLRFALPTEYSAAWGAISALKYLLEKLRGWSFFALSGSYPKLPGSYPETLRRCPAQQTTGLSEAAVKHHVKHTRSAHSVHIRGARATTKPSTEPRLLRLSWRRDTIREARRL